jgi:hypothetical protein
MKDSVKSMHGRWQWLESTRQLQTETYGYDLDGLREAAEDGDSQPLAAYIDWNQIAIVEEASELRKGFSWKPWATDAPFVRRQYIIEEAVDLLHFIGNILVGLGVTDAELRREYQAKQQINRERQRSSIYSALKDEPSMHDDK